MKLFTYKKRRQNGQFDRFGAVYTGDILDNDYFRHWLWGGVRRRVANRIFKFIKKLQK